MTCQQNTFNDSLEILSTAFGIKVFYVLVIFRFCDVLKKSYFSPQSAMPTWEIGHAAPPQIPVPWVKETVTIQKTVLVI